MGLTQVMSTLRLIVPYNFASLHNGSGCRFRTINPSSSRFLVVPNQNMKYLFPGYQSLRNLSAGSGVQNAKNMKMNTVVHSGVNPIPPLPSDHSPASWKYWILGMLMTVISPFLTNKLGPLLILKNKIETVVEEAEFVTDIVEKVAEEVDKVAEEVADHLPEGGKLKSAVTFIEKVAEETAKDAQLVEEFIDKIEAIEEKVESFIKPVATDQADK